MEEPFVSYAQNGEDALLFHALRDVQRGFYIDVGANDPDVHSVTRAFYERGWSGINVEPLADCCERLKAARPRDVTLRVAVGHADGELDFFEIPDTGLSTLDRAIADGHRAAGRDVQRTAVSVRRLAEIWDEHVRGVVHFLKIDVEGGEAAVLAGIDLSRQRPWVIVIESTSPVTRGDTSAEWQATLDSAAYRLAHFDGLNRYYVACEHDALVARLNEAGLAPPAFVTAAELAAQSPDPSTAVRLQHSQVAFLCGDGAPPTLEHPVTQLCTRAQFREAAYARWCRALREPPLLHRKQWEFVFILRVLDKAGMLALGRRGVGFGCGREPLAAASAARGAEVLATDLPAGSPTTQRWGASGQHASDVADLGALGLCNDAEALDATGRLSFRAQDMREIASDLGTFDFAWSCSALEHLGSIGRALTFIVDATQRLRPGGLAVHTTQFNLSSNTATLEGPDISVLRRRDVERLGRMLEARGDRLAPLNFFIGSDALDRDVSLPPYRSEPQLRVSLGGCAITSLGIVVLRGQ